MSRSALMLLLLVACGARAELAVDECDPPTFTDPSCAHFGASTVCGADDATQWEKLSSGELLHYRLSDGEKLCDVASDGHVIWRAK